MRRPTVPVSAIRPIEHAQIERVDLCRLIAAAAAPQAPVTATSSPSSGATVSAPPAVTDARTSALPAVDNAAAAAPLANSAAATPTPVAPAQVPPTPLGVWATEEHKGMVRIEPCGQDLCGYAVKTG